MTRQQLAARNFEVILSCVPASPDTISRRELFDKLEREYIHKLSFRNRGQLNDWFRLLIQRRQVLADPMGRYTKPSPDTRTPLEREIQDANTRIRAGFGKT